MVKNSHIINYKNKRKLLQKENLRMFPAYRNNLDTMKLLTTSSVFQEIVKDTRVFLNIPEGGLDCDDEVSVRKWTDEMRRSLDEDIASPVFNNQLRKIYEKRKNKEIDEVIAKKQLYLLHNSLSWNRLRDSVDFIVDKFKIPLNFDENVREYIIFNEISAPLKNFEVGQWVVSKITSTVLPYLSVRIYSKLTNKELKQIKEATESILGEKLPKYDGIKNIDQQMKLDDWNRHKERFDQVERKKYKMTAKEISENILKSRKKAQKVYDSTRGLKKLRKKRFGIE